MADPPEHTRYRAILQRVLIPAKTLRELTPRIQIIVDELIDGFCESGSCEFVREFAYPLPMRIVAALLDVRDDQIDMLKGWSDDFISVQAGNIPDDRVVAAARHTIEFEEFILAKLEERRREKRDDLLGRLIDVPEGEKPLTVQELLNFALQILVGGNESTTNFLGNGLYQLLTTPGLIAEIQNNPKRIPDIVEEILRHDAPLQGLFRVALEDHDFDGVTVPKGAKLMLSFGSANHDEKYYGDAVFRSGSRTPAAAAAAAASAAAAATLLSVAAPMPARARPSRGGRGSSPSRRWRGDARFGLSATSGVQRRCFSASRTQCLYVEFTPQPKIKPPRGGGRRMKIEVDPSAANCMGRCAFVAPEFFRIENDTLIVEASVPEELRQKAETSRPRYVPDRPLGLSRTANDLDLPAS